MTELVGGSHHRYPKRADDGCGRQARCGPSGRGPRRVPGDWLRHRRSAGTRRNGQSALLQAGYILIVCCSGESRGDGVGEKGQDGGRLVVRKSIFRAEVRSPEFISDRLQLKVTLELGGRARAVMFVVVYVPTYTKMLLGKVSFLDSPGEGSSGSARARTCILVNGRQHAHGRDGGEKEGFEVRNVKLSAPTAERLSTIMVSDSFNFLPITIGLHCQIRSLAPPSTQLRIRSTGETKNVLTTSSRGNRIETRARRFCSPPTAIPTYLGSQIVTKYM